MKRLRPRQCLCTVSVIESREIKTVSGIILPADNGLTFQEAVILDVGPGVWDNGKYVGVEGLAPGMHVIVKGGIRQDGQVVMKLPSFAMERNAPKVQIIDARDIFAIIEEEPAPSLKLTDAPPDPDRVEDAH